MWRKMLRNGFETRMQQAAMIPTSLPLLISLSAPISYMAMEDYPVCVPCSSFPAAEGG